MGQCATNWISSCSTDEQAHASRVSGFQAWARLVDTERHWSSWFTDSKLEYQLRILAYVRWAEILNVSTASCLHGKKSSDDVTVVALQMQSPVMDSAQSHVHETWDTSTFVSTLVDLGRTPARLSKLRGEHGRGNYRPNDRGICQPKSLQCTIMFIIQGFTEAQGKDTAQEH